MKFLFLILTLFSFNVFSQVYPVGVTPSVELGGATLPASKSVILVQFPASTNYLTFKNSGSSYADYQVPAGRTLVILTCAASGSSTLTSGYIGYGDNAVAGAGAPTNDVSFGSGMYSYFNGASGAIITTIMGVRIPATKYPYIKAGSATGHWIRCLSYLE